MSTVPATAEFTMTIDDGARDHEAALREDIFRRIKGEWQDSIAALLKVLDQGALLEQSPQLARSIRNRFAYIDPLNHVQLQLLKRYRTGSTDDHIIEGIHLTINGIATGLRNSG